MKIMPNAFAAALVLGVWGCALTAEAAWPRCATTWSCQRPECQQPWYGANPYYDAAWGMPVAVLVPPTAGYQTHWAWGVGNTWITPNCPQFTRDWPGPAYYDRRMFGSTPPWPSSTDQFGDYYVRGPW